MSELNYRFPQSFPKPLYLCDTAAIHFPILKPSNLPPMVQDSSSPLHAILFYRPSTARMEQKILTINSLPTTSIVQRYWFLFIAIPNAHCFFFPPFQTSKMSLTKNKKTYFDLSTERPFPRATAHCQYVITITQ